MKGQFHVNPETYVVAPCHAEKIECPYLHGDTVEDTERLLSEKIGTSVVLQGISVSKLRNMPAEVLKATSLKELDAAQLTQTLRHEAIEQGMKESVIDSAIDLASILHAHQTRGNRGNFTSTPYIEHPLRNALRLLRLGVNNQDVIVASLLHDVIEDGAQVFVKTFKNIQDNDENDARRVLSDHIRNAYGDNVLELVEAVTNDYIADVDKSRMQASEKNRIYLEHVRKNIAGRPNVILVKVSDFMDNATGLHHHNTPQRAEKTFRQACKYLPVVQVFRDAIRANDLSLSYESVSKILEKMDKTERSLMHIITTYQEKMNSE